MSDPYYLGVTHVQRMQRALHDYIKKLELENNVLTKNLDTATANIEDQVDRIEELEHRLRDVVIEATTFTMITHFDRDIIEAAGYTRCERCVGGVAPRGGNEGTTRYDCDCINGWRPSDGP